MTGDHDYGDNVHLSNAKATPEQFPGSAQTQNDRATWNEMDAVSDKIALIVTGPRQGEGSANGIQSGLPISVETKTNQN